MSLTSAFHETGSEHLKIHVIFQINGSFKSGEFEIMVGETL
ncbi:MAG: hypothetical protein ACM31J_00240 [Nitrososphaerales archaeon]